MAKKTALVYPNPVSGLIVDFVAALDNQPGVFATKIFQPKQLIFKVTGPVIKRRTKYSFPLSRSEHIDPTENGTPGFGHYLNHSCNPNAYAKIIDDTKGGEHIEIIARKLILKGDHIRVDYGAMEYTTTVSQLTCRCAESNCRGKITGFKDLDQKTKEAYLNEGIIPAYLIALLKR